MEKLSKRELQIATLIADEYCDKQIADKLNIALNTVKNHNRNIREKTNSLSRVGIAKYIIRNENV